MPKKKNFLGGMQNYDPKTGEYEPALEGANGEKPSSFKSFNKPKSELEKANDKRLGKNVNLEATNESDDEEGVGKVIKYRPFLSGAGGDRWGDEEIRAKKLNNGIAMETKKFKSGGQFNKDENGKYVPKQYYKLVDIESGLSVGKAESYEEALAKSKDPEFIEKLERAREAYWKKHPDRRESKPQKGDKTKLTEEEKAGVKDIDSKKAMLKARKYMEKFWANTSAGNHMRSEMDYLLSNFENDNDKEGAIALAKDNIKKWQRIGFLDQSGNELRDEKLAYFNRMIEYMEKNK